MKDEFAEDFILSTLRKKLQTNISKYLRYRKIRCLLQEIRTNLCEEIIRLYTSMKEFGLARDV
jgi:hypothetical protein